MKTTKPGPTEVGIYNEAVKRISGKDLRELNVRETKSIARAISPLFGPKGSSKMILHGSTELNVTHKGYEVIKTFKSRLPISQMLIKLVQTQENNYGDGTKTVALLSGLLLEKAWNLLAQGIPPQVINKGYSLATTKALEILEENAIAINQETEQEILKQVFSSVMTSKLTTTVKRHFATLLLNTINSHADLFINSRKFDFSDFYFRKAPGRGMSESELIEGMIIYKKRANSSTPIRIENPGILLVPITLDFFIKDQTSVPREASIKDPAKLKEFGHFNRDYYKNLALSFRKKGVNIILCQKRINEEFIDICNGLGMIALELVGEQEIKKLSKMLNVGPVATVTTFTSKEVGKVDLAEFVMVTNDEMFFVRKRNSGIFTFLVRGGTQHVLEELGESLQSAFKVAIQTIRDHKVLPGAGALECEMATQLKKYATTFANTTQMVVEEFATALENVPGYLVTNAGADPLEVITTLRSCHKKGQKHDGFDCNSNSIVDVVTTGILDGYSVKKHALKISSEMACQTIRVDDLIMVYDRRLYEQLKEAGKPAKMEKRNEQMRKYLQKHERDFVPS